MPDAALATRAALALGVSMNASVDPGCAAGNYYPTGASILADIDAFTNDLAGRIGVTGSAAIARLAPASFGIWSTFSVTARAAPFPSPPVGGVYGGGNQGGLFPDTTLMDGLRDRGITPMVYMEPDTVGFTAIADGDYDTYWNDWADAANIWRNESSHIGQKNDKGRYKDSTVILRFAQEMNMKWPPWALATLGGHAGNTIATFQAAWRRIHDIVVRKAPHVKMYYCPWGENAEGGSPTAFYPGDAYCEFVGFDIYDFSGTNTLPGRFQASLNEVHAYASKAKKIIVGEYGILDKGWNHSQRDKFITKGLPWARKNGFKGLVYFDINPRDVCDPSPWLWALSTTRKAYASRSNQRNFQGRYGNGDKPASQAASYSGPLPDDDDAIIISSDDGGIDIAVATYQEGTWTPTLTCATPGDLSVGYGTRIGRYTRIGNRILVMVSLSTSVWTHSTATGALRITGLPFVPVAASSEFLAGAMNRYTKASYTQVLPFINAATGVINFWATGSGQVGASLDAADMPSGTTFTLWASGHYQV